MCPPASGEVGGHTTNRRELEEHLRAHGCERIARGRKHDRWQNPATGARSFVPRHRTVKKPLARGICQTLGVPPPAGL
jgi:hypothetical protein